jgi:hypothetical protein
MKKLIISQLVLLLVTAQSWAGGILNNSSSGTISPEDSIAVLLKSVDSIGNPVAADSFYILVVGPKGDSVFAERGTNTGLSRIDSVRAGSVTSYVFKAQVSDIDGSGLIGKYTLQVYPKKNSPLYITLNIFEFQIAGAELSDALDSAGLAARGGIFTTSQRDSILSALADAVLGNKVWNRSYTSAFTAGSIGDSLNNKSPNEIFAAVNDSARVYRQAGRAIHDSTATIAVMTDSVWAKQVARELTRSLMPAKGKVGGVPSTAGFSSAALTQPTDGFWNDNLIVFYTGALSGQVARIVDFRQAADSITVSPPFTSAPATTDSFAILGILSDYGYAASVDSNNIYRQSARAIHDSTTTQADLVAAVWNEDTSGNGQPNSFGLMAQRAGISSGSSNWTDAQRDSVIAALADNNVANKVWKADTAGRTSGSNWFGRLSKISGDSSLWAKPIDLWNQPFNAGFSAGSMGDSLRKPSYIGNLHSVSGNSTAATNFRSMLDGSGGSTLSLGQLSISGANGSTGSFRVTNSTGSATVFTGSSNGHGFSLIGQGTGSGLNAVGGASGWKINADIHGSIDTVLKGAQGSGCGGDSTSIARWVWNTPHDNHITSGTFGQFLDVEVSSLAAGAGAWSFTVVASDTANDQIVPNAIVSIRNLEQTALIAVGTTNSLGRAWFNLNSGQYLAMVISPGYSFPAYDTVVVLGPGADTVRGYQFNPGAPASPSLCRVYGYLYGVNGQPEWNAAVSAVLPKGVSRTNAHVISPFAVSTVSDSTGYFFLDLIPSDSLHPVGTTYEISIGRPDGAILRKRLTVPAQPNWQLTW